MVENQAAGGAQRFGLFRRVQVPMEKQTRDTEENRPLRYSILRMWLRLFALFLVFLEIIVIGPALPLWSALAALFYGFDQVRIVLDTRAQPDIIFRPKAGIQHDVRFMGLTILAIASATLVAQDLWFPIWFEARDGFLWWESAESVGRILPQAGALAVWIRLFFLAGIPMGFWDPLRVLDWVYKVESVWTQYRNTQFAPANAEDIPTPMGSLKTAPSRPKPGAEPITVRLTSAPLPISGNGGEPVKAIEPERTVVDV